MDVSKLVIITCESVTPFLSNSKYSADYFDDFQVNLPKVT